MRIKYLIWLGIFLAGCASNRMNSDPFTAQSFEKSQPHTAMSVEENASLPASHRKYGKNLNKPQFNQSNPIDEDANLTPSKSQKQALSTQTASIGKMDKMSKADKMRSTPGLSKTNAVKSWQISGALAARGNGKNVSASFNWLQHGAENYQIRMFGPLGSGTVIIRRQGGTTTYQDGPKRDADSSATALFRRQTGVSLPVNYLYYWVRGLPAPGNIQGEKRNGQALYVLRQAGYTIQYLGYSDMGGVRLPNKIQIQGPNVFVKLVIRNWRF